MKYEYPVEISEFTFNRFKSDLYDFILQYLYEQCGENAPVFSWEDLEKYVDSLGWFTPVHATESMSVKPAYRVSPNALEEDVTPDNWHEEYLILDGSRLIIAHDGYYCLVYGAVNSQVVSARSGGEYLLGPIDFYRSIDDCFTPGDRKIGNKIKDALLSLGVVDKVRHNGYIQYAVDPVAWDLYLTDSPSGRRIRFSDRIKNAALKEAGF